MDTIDILKNVPKSYNDFVDYTIRCMEKDVVLKDAVIEFINENPTANAGEVLMVVFSYLGLGNPLEIVSDEEYEEKMAMNKPVFGAVG